MSKTIRAGTPTAGLSLHGTPSGTYEWAPFALGTRPEGYWMWCPCVFAATRSTGGHWLAPAPDTDDHRERVIVQTTPYAWASAAEAEAARERYVRQQQER